MSSSKKRPTTALERGSWPEKPGQTFYEDPIEITIRLDRPVYEWLENFVADSANSFFPSVEGAITTAIRGLMGDDHPHGLHAEFVTETAKDMREYHRSKD